MRERRISVAHVDPRIADVDFWSPERQHKGRRLLPRIVRDPLSGFFALRALPLDDGQQIDLDVLDGAALVARGARRVIAATRVRARRRRRARRARPSASTASRGASRTTGGRAPASGRAP